MPLRIIFMGTPDFSVPSLVALAEAGHEIIACYSQPPRPAGRRGLELKKSPVHAKAEELGIFWRRHVLAVITDMLHCCQDGAALHPYNAQSWQAIKKLA